MDRLGITLVNWQKVSSSDPRQVIVVDTNTASLLTGCKKNEFLAIIDHHELSQPELTAKFRIINKNAISVCEIIASLIPEEDIDSLSALALAVGISGDSKRLRNIDDDTLAIFDRLVEISRVSKSTIEAKNMIDMLAYPPLDAELVAKIMDDLKNMSTETYRGRTISVGPSALENPAILASRVNDMDVSIVGVLSVLNAANTADEDWYKISFRVGYPELRSGISAKSIAKRTSEICGMPPDMLGGGHDLMAAAVIKNTYDNAVSAVFQAAKEAIDNASGQKV